MKPSALAQLRRLQKDLYEQAYTEAHSVVHGESKNILSYSAKFEESLPDRTADSSLSSILECLRQRQILLFGDFHTLRQCQRGFLRLIRSYQERMRTSKIVIALEMLKGSDQQDVDLYMSGAISEAEFLQRIDYENSWGFPWHNFKMILDYARLRNLPVVGVNTENAGKDTLLSRDKYTAEVLVKLAEAHPKHKIFCLIGEYHLADSHLPLQVSKLNRKRKTAHDIMRVLCNTDKYYFSSHKKNDVSSTEYLQLEPDFFCIINSPPWMKWRSFSIWEEMRITGQLDLADEEGDLDSDIDIHTEEQYDVDYQFLQFCKTITEFLRLKVEDSDLENFYITFSKDADFLSDLEGVSAANPHLYHTIVERVGVDGVYFLNANNTVLLSYLSINNLAEAAGQFLQKIITGYEDLSMYPTDAFYRRVIKNAVGMIASKILNPRRKSTSIRHEKQYLRKYSRKRLEGRANLRRDTAKLILKHHDWIKERIESGEERYVRPQKSIYEKDIDYNFEISRSIGQFLGINLYNKVMSNQIPTSSIRHLFVHPLNDFDSVWQEVLALYSYLDP